jgi:type I restriction enzyme, R subunit
MPNFISEDDIEKACLQRLSAYGYKLLDCFTQDPADLNDLSNRANKEQVILTHRLQAALERLNPGLPQEALELALEQVSQRRFLDYNLRANKEVYGLIQDGVTVEFDDEAGKPQQARVKLIDFDNPSTEGSANEFLAVAQLWLKGENKWRRPDVILYVNGLPLVFMEFKNSNVKLKTAYDENLTNYKEDIPQLFLTNAFCILSNAVETRVGSFTAKWDRFFQWLRVGSEKEHVDRERIASEGTSIEYVLQGLCKPEKLLDYLENYILYYNDSSKIIAQNHQFIGVNNAFEIFKRRKELDGKLGVFWHTQGSGKSFSMIFYARKIKRKLPGDFTFLIVTDRTDLDGQIYRNFLGTETVKKSDTAQPKNSEELRKYLSQNKSLVFSLIQKFRFDKGKEYPTLSPRDDIVVIVDEAHRTQYEALAHNMRKGLPKAQFIAFTGTPLLGRERKTNAWFGDYVSEYNFQQSIEDGATVPLYYEKRVPEVLNQNEDLSEEFYDLLESEELSEAQKARLEDKYAREIEVIKRPDRLETVARDIVDHFPKRGYLGKGIVIAVDKFTAVKMYDLVGRYWQEAIKTLRGQVRGAQGEVEKDRLKKRLEWMRSVEMAVVISYDHQDLERFESEGLNLKPHIERMNELDEHGHDIEHNFKDPEHPLQLVFVCAMWLTGFDAETVSTLYLDKPMQGHTLMQTIARANRVTSHVINGVAKRNGEIIDYYNVFRNLNKALRDYGQGESKTDDKPVQPKTELFKTLDDAIREGLTWCLERGIDLEALTEQEDVFKNIAAFKEYANILLGFEEGHKTFKVYDNTISALYEACKPEIIREPRKLVFVFQYLRGVIDSIVDEQDINEVARRIAELLDESVVVHNPDALAEHMRTAQYQIIKKGKTWDLSKIDYELLRVEFKETQYKNIEIASLKAFIEDKLTKMLRVNTTRVDFAERFQQIIDGYNAGSSSADTYFEDLLNFNRDLHQEDERHIREGLSPDELELFDLIKKDKLTQAETQKVKLAAKQLLKRLVEESPKVLIQDWYRDTQSQQSVRSEVEKVLDKNLPESYDRVSFKQACDLVYDKVFDYSRKGLKWAA